MEIEKSHQLNAPWPPAAVEKPPFQVTETGWGEFEIQIKIFFVPEANEKPITYFHHLKLHPWLSPSAVAAIPPPPPSQEPPLEASSTSDKPMTTDEPAGGHTVGSAANQVAETAPSEAQPDSHNPEASALPEEAASTNPQNGASTGGNTVEASTAAIPSTTAAHAPQPQMRMPPVIHSWQYEEIVFPEPSEAFYEILIRHPPTP